MQIAETVYERLEGYRKQQFLNEQENVRLFMEAIEKGEYLQKCLECYKAGLNYCCFWNTGFNCESHEVKEKMKRLL